MDPDVGGLDVLLDGVDHPALLVHHRRQVLEDGVHVDDVGLEKVEEVKTIKSNEYTASLSQLRTMLPESSSRPLPAKRPYHAT